MPSVKRWYVHLERDGRTSVRIIEADTAEEAEKSVLDSIGFKLESKPAPPRKW